jgi:EpsG family
VSPALGLAKLFQAKNDRFIIVGCMLTMSLFGALFAYPEGSDGHTHYMRSIEQYTYMNFSQFFAEAWDIILQKSKFGTTDLYIHVLSFISNSLLGLPKSLHFFAGLVLGYFIAKSLLLILGDNLKSLRWKNGLWIFIILLTLHSVYSLNAIRISTGIWVLFFGACGYYFTKKAKFLLLFLVASQIHLALVVMVIPVVLVFFLNKFKWLIVGIWGFSFFFQLDFVDVASYLPATEVIETKKKFYVLDEERLKDFKEIKESQTGNWYTLAGPRLYYNVAILIAVIGVLLIYLKSSDSKFNFLFASALLFYTFANIVSFTPSLQGRLMNGVSIFILFALLYCLQYGDLSYTKSKVYQFFKLSIFLFSLFSIPFLIKNFSHILNTTEVFFLAAPILSFFSEESLSLRELIGDIL